MQKDKGFIRLSRKITENKLWFCEPFDRSHAWIDLLLICEHTAGQFFSKRGLIQYQRGECTYSLSDLAERWNWSRWKVRNFLTYLEENNMIQRRVEKKTYSIITVLNYDKYQNSGTKSRSKKDSDGFDYDKARAFLMGDDNE